MSFTHRVILHGAALALSGLLLSAQAFAQAQRVQPNEPDRTVGSGIRMEEPRVPEAPVGHRQPRASDIPATQERDPSDEWLNRVNRETDRKLEICRGC